MKLLDRLGITGWEEREEMSYLDYLSGEAWERGAHYTPGNGYDTSKRWRGWLHMLIRFLPHIRAGRFDGQPFAHFTLIQIPMRRYGDHVWAVGICADKYEDGWHVAGRLGEY